MKKAPASNGPRLPIDDLTIPFQSHEELKAQIADLEERRDSVINPQFGSKSIYYNSGKLTKFAKDSLKRIDGELTTLKQYERRTYRQSSPTDPGTTTTETDHHAAVVS